MQKFFILGICNVFLFFNLIPNGYSESQIYENQDFGFMIEYPYDWILNDTLPQTNKWNEIVSIVPPTEEWSQEIYVNKWIGDLKNKMFDSSAYLEAHNKAAKEWCSSISIEENGFGCTNYVLVDQKTISVSGRESFLLEENWIRIDDTGNSTVTVYNLQIPDGDDR